MPHWIDPIHQTIGSAVAEVLGEQAHGPPRPQLVEQVQRLLAPPPQSAMGHLALGCFAFAKQQRQSPQVIAQKLAENLDWPAHRGRVQAAGPYLNFHLAPAWVGQQVAESILDGRFFQGPGGEFSGRTMVEYSQPNTHKELHVGHMRNLCLGKALIAIMRYCGEEVVSATYPGDVGTHVAKCLWYKEKHQLSCPEGEEKGAWLGRLYSQANNALEEQKGTPEEEQARAELGHILKQIERAEGPYFECWKETRQWSIDLMEKLYRWSDVTFERWYFESQVDAPSVRYARELLEKGLLQEDQGAVGMDLKEEGLGFCLLIKSDGNGLYATKDVELARRKFQDEAITRNIYVVDNRQSFHFQQVFKVLEKIGFENADKCFHLAYEMVELPDGAMSSRKGNIVPIMSLIEEMEKKITRQHLEKYRGQWSDEKIQQRAREVARGAIHYGMLTLDPNKKIIFDQDQWLKLDGDSGPYIQYVYARINSLCEKQGQQACGPIPWQALAHPKEADLLAKLQRFNQVVLAANENFRPHQICNYLYELAKLFNAFYAECSIANAPGPEVKTARLALAKACSLVLQKGLELIGAPAPERM